MILSEDLKYSGTPTLPEHNDLEAIKAMPSPRILAFHTHYKFLPRQVKEGKGKIIYLLRNPKDLVTSLYLFYTKMVMEVPTYSGNWRGFLRFFLQNDCNKLIS